jgi:hypothetical protein
MLVNIVNIATKNWMEFQRVDLDVLAEVYAETVKACAEEAGKHSEEAKKAILEKSGG